jgi:hypothetical protein
MAECSNRTYALAVRKYNSGVSVVDGCGAVVETRKRQRKRDYGARGHQTILLPTSRRARFCRTRNATAPHWKWDLAAGRQARTSHRIRSVHARPRLTHAVMPSVSEDSRRWRWAWEHCIALPSPQHMGAGA